MFAAQRRNRFVSSYKPPADIMKFKELSRFIRDDNTSEFMLGDNVVSTVTSLLKTDGVGVVNALVPDGETFPTHEHDVYEWLIPYAGTMKIDTGGSVVMVGPDKEMKYIVFTPGVSHTVSAVGDVGVIGITVPPDAGYPGDEL